MCILCVNKQPLIKDNKLEIYYCNYNQTIPYIKDLKKLKLYYNFNLSSIENNNLEELDLVECPKIINIAKFPNLKRIQIRNCINMNDTFNVNNILLSKFGSKKKKFIFDIIKYIDNNNILSIDLHNYIYRFIT